MSTPPTQNSPAQNYVRYVDGVEQIQPDEDRLIDETAESMHRVARFMADKFRHAMRDAHAKSHALLRGEIEIYSNLPEHLRQGVFKEARTYPVIIRLSSAPPAIQSDTQSTFQGFALKIVGVEGTKFLPEQKDEKTQDFLMVNHPVIDTGDIKSYHDLQLKLEQSAYQPDVVQSTISKVAQTAHNVLEKVGIDFQPDLAQTGYPSRHILGETYHTMGAIRYGDYVSKISVTPFSESVKALEGKKVDLTDHVWRDVVREFFASNSAEYELRAQLCVDLAQMPVEDASVEWKPELSPFQPIARIRIAPQETYGDERRAFGDDKLSFNPFHCLPEHRPLGSINRARIKAYERSTAYRHAYNVQPRIEPKSIDELPA